MSLFEFEIPLATLSPEHLDRRMAEGWFRSGPILYRSDSFCLDNEIVGLVQIRLPLESASPSRNRRRLLRRNRRHFRCEFGPASVDRHREQLYQATKHRFQGAISTELSPLVFGASSNVFDTRECCVYDGEKLIAVSYFDVGRECIVSQLALHHPDYQRFSLGFYTLLEEIEYGREAGARYHYPGYIIPGNPAFSYKLRIGDVQYLERDQRWRKRSQPPGNVAAADRVMEKVLKLERVLEYSGTRYERWSNPGYWIGQIEGTEHPYLSAMLHAKCSATDARGRFYAIEYLTVHCCYQLSRVSADPALNIAADCESLPPRCQPFALRYEDIICRDPSALAIVQRLRQLNPAPPISPDPSAKTWH